jgi:hypothetical protein
MSQMNCACLLKVLIRKSIYFIFVSFFIAIGKNALAQPNRERWVWDFVDNVGKPPSDSHGSDQFNIALVAHGLNLKPSKMEKIGRFWKSRNYNLSYLQLSGHLENEGELFAQVTSEARLLNGCQMRFKLEKKEKGKLSSWVFLWVPWS